MNYGDDKNKLYEKHRENLIPQHYTSTTGRKFKIDTFRWHFTEAGFDLAFEFMNKTNLPMDIAVYDQNVKLDKLLREY